MPRKQKQGDVEKIRSGQMHKIYYALCAGTLKLLLLLQLENGASDG